MTANQTSSILGLTGYPVTMSVEQTSETNLTPLVLANSTGFSEIGLRLKSATLITLYLPKAFSITAK